MILLLKLARIGAKLFFRLTIIILSTYGAFAAILSVLLLNFMFRTENYDAGDDTPHTAIVFTGHFGRIEKGLDFLNSGQADQLFVSGVNGDAGLSTDRFALQFDLKPEKENLLDSGVIVLAVDAHNTFENAWETACWLDQNPKIAAVTLITSRVHMARASVALQHAIAPVKVVRVISDPENTYDKLQIDLLEFGKFVATWGITLLPYTLWPANEPRICTTHPLDF